MTQLFITPDNEIGELKLQRDDRSANDAKAAGETLRVTAEHPFFIPGRGWIEAGKLRAGDRVVISGESDAALRVAGPWVATGKTTTYNFEVADFHTYFAGRSRVWVHNVCTGIPGPTTRAAKRQRDANLPAGLSTDNIRPGKRTRRAPERLGFGGGSDGIRGPGPFAVRSIPGHAGRNFSRQTRERIDQIGKAYGCHACGTKNPGTQSGHFIVDHQPALSVFREWEEYRGRFFPHCLACSNEQGGHYGYRPASE